MTQDLNTRPQTMSTVPFRFTIQTSDTLRGKSLTFNLRPFILGQYCDLFTSMTRRNDNILYVIGFKYIIHTYRYQLLWEILYLICKSQPLLRLGHVTSNQHHDYCRLLPRFRLFNDYLITHNSQTDTNVFYTHSINCPALALVMSAMKCVDVCERPLLPVYWGICGCM